jgi:hypothetical protein
VVVSVDRSRATPRVIGPRSLRGLLRSFGFGRGRVRTDSLLAHFIAQALRVWGDGVSSWQAVRVTPRAARQTGFVVLWAQLLDERGVDSISIEDYAAVGYDSRRTSYRRLAEFRELFPEETDPNRIARLVCAAARARRQAPSADLAVAL